LPPLEDIADPNVIEGQIVNPENQVPAESAAAMRANFERKWACLSFHKKVNYLRKRFPEKFKQATKQIGAQRKQLKGATE
jgi:hypothetical protein